MKVPSWPESALDLRARRAVPESAGAGPVWSPSIATRRSPACSAAGCAMWRRWAVPGLQAGAMRVRSVG